MKKIFNAKSLSQISDNNIANSSNLTQTFSNFIGKLFQLPRYTVAIEDVIAEGGFSIVFLARSESNGKKYALKRMYVNNQSDLEICKQEIEIIKNLSIKNKKILKYVDSSIQRQQSDIYEILLLTKYCKYGGLVQLMNDRISGKSGINYFNENEIIHIFCDICEALSELHINGIIHRDLKIENILIDDSSLDVHNKRANPIQNCLLFNFVLCDFGSCTNKTYERKLNNSIQNVQTLTDEIQKYTTLAYRSPEMVDLYSNKPITTKSDIWALGCLLYKLCYFQTPFGESQLAIQEGRFTIPDNKSNYYSKKLNSLINYMLDVDPLKRPDIFQVSYLAFSLTERICPINNINATEIPSFNQLQAPLTETEWRKAALMMNQQKRHQIVSNENNTTTTVNPRERPKANINSINPIIPLSNSNFNKRTPSQPPIASSSNQKINVSIKPSHFLNEPSNNQIVKEGFDDDFSSLNPASFASGNKIQEACLNENMINNKISSPINNDSNSFSKSSNEIINNQDLFQNLTTLEKKTHRRSASHSTIILQPNAQYSNTNINQQNEINYSSPSQFHNKLNYLRGLNPSPSISNYDQNTIIYNHSTFPANSYAFNFIHHSRSASASPNVASLASILKMPIKPKINEAPGEAKSNTQLNSDFNLVNNQSNIKKNSDINNPFGDSFSQLNDNEIFGLEFDKLRQQNEKSSPNSINVNTIMTPSQHLSSSNNNINVNTGNLSEKFNYYQNNQKSNIKSNSCINISLNNINTTNTIIDRKKKDNNDFDSDNNNNNNNNNTKTIFITHF